MGQVQTGQPSPLTTPRGSPEVLSGFLHQTQVRGSSKMRHLSPKRQELRSSHLYTSSVGFCVSNLEPKNAIIHKWVI